MRNKYHKIHIAFTLAEVLITLGIIGIVAAMTLPSVINSTKNKELEVALKKQYSVLSQALLKMQADGYCTIPECLSSTTLYQYIGTVTKNIKKCETGTEGCFQRSRDRHYTNYTKTNTYIVSDGLDDEQFYLVDGALVTCNVNHGSSAASAEISVDVNDYWKKPNALGHDVFIFKIKNKGGTGVLVPAGANGERPEHCSTTSSFAHAAYNGLTCAAKALSDPNYFKNLP